MALKRLSSSTLVVLALGLVFISAGLLFLAPGKLECALLSLSPDAHFTQLTRSLLAVMPRAVLLLGVCTILATVWRRPLLRLLERVGGLLEALPEDAYAAGLVAVALAVRLAWVVSIDTQPVVDFAYYEEKAWEVARGLGYQAGGKPTAFRPPGYILWLAAIYAVFGRRPLAGQIANAVLSALVCLLVYRIARKELPLGASRAAGVIAAFFPSQIFYCSLLGTEGLFTFLFVTAVWMWVQGLDRASWKIDAATGLSLGLATLVRPVSLFLPGVLFLHLKLYGKGWAESARRPFVVGLVMLLTILPWSLRNLIVMKAPVLISTNGGITLWMGLNEQATGTFMSVPAGHPLRAIEDEIEKSEAASRLARQFAVEHPGRALALTLKKLFYLYATDLSGAQFSFAKTQRPVPTGFKVWSMIAAQVFYLAAMALALWGGGRFFPRWRHAPVQGLLVGMLLYFTFFYAGIFHGEDRFHHPLVPLVSVLAARGAFGQPKRVSQGGSYVR